MKKRRGRSEFREVERATGGILRKMKFGRKLRRPEGTTKREHENERGKVDGMAHRDYPEFPPLNILSIDLAHVSNDTSPLKY